MVAVMKSQTINGRKTHPYIRKRKINAYLELGSWVVVLTMAQRKTMQKQKKKAEKQKHLFYQKLRVTTFCRKVFTYIVER